MLVSERAREKMIGKRYGRLEVTARAPSRIGVRRWHCRCDCGGTVSVTTANLNNSHQRSCGCLQRESREAGNNLRHGGAKTPEWFVWVHMRRRCESHSCHAYPRYGGRGIYVCKRWQDFANFLKDMGKRPAGQTLERINNAGPYSPKNCKWASRTEQARNRRSNRIVEFSDERRCVAEWCEVLGLPHKAVRARILNGWSAERAFTQPVARRA